MTPGCSQFVSQGHDWQDLCRVSLNIFYILNIQAVGLVVSEKKIVLCYSYYNPLADNAGRWAWPIWTPGAWLAGLIRGITKHCYTQNIKALGLMVSENKNFLCSSY